MFFLEISGISYPVMVKSKYVADYEASINDPFKIGSYEIAGCYIPDMRSEQKCDLNFLKANSMKTSNRIT